MVRQHRARAQQGGSNKNSGPKQSSPGSSVSNGMKPVIRCYECNTVGHKRSQCPNLNGAMGGVCSKCRVFHAAHVLCYAWTPPSQVYAAAAANEANDECVSGCVREPLMTYGGFSVPVIVNGTELLALRDTGYTQEAIVHPDLVNQSDYTGRVISCRGAFDMHSVVHKVPNTTVELVAPSLGCFQPISVLAGVWPLSDVVVS